MQEIKNLSEQPIVSIPVASDFAAREINHPGSCELLGTPMSTLLVATTYREQYPKFQDDTKAFTATLKLIRHRVTCNE